MLTLGIRTKILLLIMAATLLPLLFLNLFWTGSQRQSLIDGARSRQALITQDDAEKVNHFITDKVRTLIVHSQSPNLQQFNLSKASLEISTLLYQDKDLTRAALVDQSGQEVMALTSDLKSSVRQNVKGSDAFKVVNYFAGNQYVSPVSIDNGGRPTVTIAIPLVTFTTPQELGTLSTAEPGVVRNPQDIKGALIVQASLENLWSSVLAAGTGTDVASASGEGYAYVVDDKGIVIAHPDNRLTNIHEDLSHIPIVSLFKKSLGDTAVLQQSLQARSEHSVDVMATYQKIPATQWAVVYQEPMSSIYQNVDQVLYLGLGISILAILVLGLLSVWLSRYITSPILRIAQAAEQIGRGDFTVHTVLRRKDEIGQLAASVNAMGGNLQAYISRIDAQRRQLEVILNSTTDGILAVGRDGRVIIANQAAAVYCEHSIEALAGLPIQTLFSWTRKLQPVVVEYAAEGTNTYSELEYTTPSGALRYADLIVVQTPSQTIVTIHDQTKSRELDTMKMDFVSIAAHELRTPLARIRGGLELVAGSNDPKAQKYAEQAQKSALELSTLISNLLDVSRIERNTLALAMDKIDLAATTSQAVHDLQPRARAKQVELQYEGAAQGEYVIADAVALREVVDNLVDNAIKYTPETGRVEVSLSRRDESYEIRIRDTGIGIPAHSLPYLFTKFYRVHNGPESGNSGTGLGLFISQSIMQRHNGTIKVESREGKGSTFTVTIPVFNDAVFAKTHQTKGVEHDTRHRGWTTKNTTRRG